MRARMKSYMCGNGSKVWKYAEPYCYVTSIPGMSGDDDQCVIFFNNTYKAVAHMEFHVFPWPLPFWNRYGWMEYPIWAPNVWGPVSGACCW